MNEKKKISKDVFPEDVKKHTIVYGACAWCLCEMKFEVQALTNEYVYPNQDTDAQLLGICYKCSTKHVEIKLKSKKERRSKNHDT